MNFMERWIARLTGHPDPGDLLAEWNREYAAELKAARESTPALPKAEVEPFVKTPRCLKCGNAGVFTAYFAGVHKGCAHLYMDDPKPEMEQMIWGRPAPRVVVARERLREAAVEHLDRRCMNCGYGWTTATAPARGAKGG